MVIQLNNPVALVALTDPELFETEPMAGDVETTGELTSGSTIFDRRSPAQWRDNMEVATSLNANLVQERIKELLRSAGDAT